ncbi:MAG: redox-sensing transcriptional repressor Rex [Christensenellaceae bacterium]|jgi:redox-sensing transcriptional repressor|nr:redox-sensing transcriptional repressor Rex [Christensenellaceae bacterium]
MELRRVSEAVVRRLPKYYRQLLLLESAGVERISSGKLAQQMRLNASQVRQDFNCFGGFGQQGYGYNVRSLLGEIRGILALDRPYKAVVVGAGNIGGALANFEGFERESVVVEALFDIKPELIGTTISGKPVLHTDALEDYIREHDIDIGMIAARRSVAQSVADRMQTAGVQGIWNFAPLDVVADIPVENIHMTDSLICLCYKINHKLPDNDDIE